MATPRRSEFLLGLLALLWGSSYILIKVPVAEIPQVTLSVMLGLVAAIVGVALINWPRDAKAS